MLGVSSKVGGVVVVCGVALSLSALAWWGIAQGAKRAKEKEDVNGSGHERPKEGKEGQTAKEMAKYVEELERSEKQLQRRILALEKAVEASEEQGFELAQEVDLFRSRPAGADFVAAERIAARQRELVKMAKQAAACARGELTHNQLVKTFTKAAYRLLKADRVSVFVVDEVREELWLAVSDDAAELGVRIPLGQGVAGSVALTRQVVNLEECRGSPLFDSSVDLTTGYETRTLVCVPIFAGRRGPLSGSQHGSGLSGPLTGTSGPHPLSHPLSPNTTSSPPPSRQTPLLFDRSTF